MPRELRPVSSRGEKKKLGPGLYEPVWSWSLLEDSEGALESHGSESLSLRLENCFKIFDESTNRIDRVQVGWQKLSKTSQTSSL